MQKSPGTFTRRQQNILISICPVLYKCIKYRLSIHWNITKIKGPEKSKQHTGVMKTGGGRSNQEHTGSIPRFPWFPPQAWVRYYYNDKNQIYGWVENWKAALLLWETQQQPPGFVVPNSCFDLPWKKGQDRNYSQCFHLNVVRHQVQQSLEKRGKVLERFQGSCGKPTEFFCI